MHTEGVIRKPTTLFESCGIECSPLQLVHLCLFVMFKLVNIITTKDNIKDCNWPDVLCDFRLNSNQY